VPDIPRESDDPAETDEEIFLEAAQRLKISEEAMGTNVSYAIDDLEFEDGQQWPDDLYNQRKTQRRPTLTINHTRTACRRVINNMRQQRPRIKVHPTGGGARVEDAKVISGLIRHIENQPQAKASVAYDTGGESAVKIGWGYWRIHADWVDEDSFDQELKILPIRNVFTVYDDPSCQMPTGSDRDWLLITFQMKRQEYKRQHPRQQLNEFQDGQSGDNQREWESKDEIRLAEYYRVRRKTETLYQMTDGTTLWASELKRLEEALQPHAQVATDPVTGKRVSRRSARRTIEWFKLNGTKIVDRRELPGKWIPVVRCLGNLLDLNGQVRLRGMVRDMKDANRMLNYWKTCQTELVALAPRAPYVAAAGQLDGHPEWKDANQKPYSALTYEPIAGPDGATLPPPMRVEGVPVPAGVMAVTEGAEHDLMALAGMPHEPGQDTPGTVVSGKALRQRQALSDMGHFQYYDNQTMAIAHTGEILLDLIPHYYSTARMQRIIGEDGVPQMIQINQPVMDPQTQAVMEVKNNLTVGRYDVVMDTGPGYETKRQEGQEAVIDLLKTPLGEPIVKTGADIIVRNMDFAGADDLADRLLPSNEQGMQKAVQALPKEAQGIVMALQTQLKQAQEVIQHQALELKYKGSIEQGWMQTDLKKTQMQVTGKVHDTEVKADTAITTQKMKDTTARDVAEIHGATQLLNTNTEAAHDRRAAEELVRNAAKAEKANGASRD
jgi:portal protein